MTDIDKQVLFYRERAEECMAIRDGMTDPTCRHTLALVAQNWHVMADNLERTQAGPRSQ